MHPKPQGDLEAKAGRLSGILQPVSPAHTMAKDIILTIYILIALQKTKLDYSALLTHLQSSTVWGLPMQT